MGILYAPNKMSIKPTRYESFADAMEYIFINSHKNH